ncbi:integrase catalytic domain-containing protein [Trichonephila clavipes]|nr:integrase catalytic domain-containing protein [Trichonephila clavipes]
MVMRNADTGCSKTDVPALYDELAVKIRALESLGRTQDMYGEFLSPLVESCLQEDILLAFERSKNFKEDTPGEGQSLKLLMNFLKQEVKNDEMIELARNNFSAPVNQKKKEVNKRDKFCSYVGPNLIEQVPDILDRFRRYPIGLSADIEKAFLQLGITPKHRDFLRFFYLDEGEEIVYLHCRVVFGVSLSPFLLAAVLAHLLENVPADETQLGSKLKLSFYADNCVTGMNDIAQQEEFILRSKEVLSGGCFNLRIWESNVEIALVRAKARVALLKQVTIPRLELMACCIGSRLAHSVQESLNITEMETVFWSDSMVALYWLREKGGWSIFVSNRIKEIKNLFPNSEWRHVPGKINPADLISRGCSFSHLVESHWWEGPLWLVESPDTWSITKLPDYDTSEISLERKKVRLCNLNLSEEMLPWYARKFSKFHLILSLVAWVIRFLNNVRSRISDRKKGQLSLDELESAGIQLVRSVQAHSFTDEKLISNLSVFRDDNNIIRVKT